MSDVAKRGWSSVTPTHFGMRIRCLFFASTRELVGQSELQFVVSEGTNSEQFKHDYLFPRFPELASVFQVSFSFAFC